ncbi:MAG TPA: hypothetical protein VMC81_05375 [Rhodocyclaceae bacterium]|nr:hypothetical protein [Rhodocyclaceae bacterium]
MNITIEDLARIRWSLLFLLAAIIIAFLMVTTSRDLVDKAQAKKQQLTAQQREIRGRLSHASDEEQELRDKIALYRQLLDRGIIGQEERLNWVEQIARIKNARRLLDLQYELSPQKPASDSIVPGGAVVGDYEFMDSTMTLQMPLLHEDDLLGFLSDLRRAVRAHLLVRECTMERLQPAGDRTLTAQLRAACTIEWITLREKRQ